MRSFARCEQGNGCSENSQTGREGRCEPQRLPSVRAREENLMPERAPHPPETIHSRAAIAGHPLHPMMIHFPVASLFMLVGSDMAYLYTSDEFWARAGLWLAGVGAAAGWGASIAGMIDLFTVRRIRRLMTGWCHAILAVMLLSLASFNWLQRFAMTEPLGPWGLYTSLLTVGFTIATGWLGGLLVYEHAVGVEVETES